MFGGGPSWPRRLAGVKSILVIVCIFALSAWARNAPDRSAVRTVSENTGGAAAGGDTLSFAVAAGLPFITVLPDAVQGRPVEAYRSLRIPARSWRRHRAFFWQTSVYDSGDHVVRFGVTDAGRVVDTLTVVVNVHP